MRLALWSPLPPSPSGIADYVLEQLPGLARRVSLQVVVERPRDVQGDLGGAVLRRCDERVDADLHLYHLGNSPAHAYAYRAALARPGVVVLHDWSLHHLVLLETVERGDRAGYLREMRRAHGEAGTFVGRQVARALGGDLFPALFPLNDRILEGSLGVVALTEWVRSRAARRLPGRPVLRLPHHLSLPLDPMPTKLDARRALSLPEDALVVTAPGLATASKRLQGALKAAGRLAGEFPGLRFVVAGAVDPGLPLEAWGRAAGLADRLVIAGRVSLPDFARHLAAADVILGLRFPTHGEISGALVRSLGAGRPVLVTSGTPATEEFPEGMVVPVDPGPHEEEQLVALLTRLLRDEALREQIGRLARSHALQHHDLEPTLDRLCAFLEEVLAEEASLRAAVFADRGADGTLLGYFMGEVRWGARELGLPRLEGIEGRLSEIAGGNP